jgi:hypothetical protein
MPTPSLDAVAALVKQRVEALEAELRAGTVQPGASRAPSRGGDDIPF